MDPVPIKRGPGRPKRSEQNPDQFSDRYPWAAYHGGKWQRHKPRRPGLYPIASRTGVFCGYREFTERRGEIVDALAGPGDPGWEGWIWSERLPEPPAAPEDWYAVKPALVPPLEESPNGNDRQQ